MGLIIGPVFLFWIAMVVYSSIIGYKLLSSSPSLLSGCILAMVALFLVGCYLLYGFSTFKSHKTLGAFEIIFYFTANKYTFFIFIVGILIQWFSGNILNTYILKTIPFLVMITISLGAVSGVLLSDSFMDKFNIKRTY